LFPAGVRIRIEWGVVLKKGPMMATFAALLVLMMAGQVSDQPEARMRVLPAHAHNDYYHPRPLLDALEHGFRSVEADVFLVDGALLVGHARFELRGERTLESLYLDPLRAWVGRHEGAVYPGGPPLILLIDIKTDGAATYRVLRDVLAQYADILTRVENGELHEGAVTAVISGNRDWDLIAADDPRYAGIDGRMGDLDRNVSSTLMPLVSDRWGTHFRWNGTGDMPADERSRLRELVSLAHQQGRLIRFWGTPEVPDLWQELVDAQVDLINTDRLRQLRDFLSGS
jgi:hypothetical protein